MSTEAHGCAIVAVVEGATVWYLPSIFYGYFLDHQHKQAQPATTDWMNTIASMTDLFVPCVARLHSEIFYQLRTFSKGSLLTITPLLLTFVKVTWLSGGSTAWQLLAALRDARFKQMLSLY